MRSVAVSLPSVRRLYLGLQFVLGVALFLIGVCQSVGITAWNSPAVFYFAVGLTQLGLGAFLLRESRQPTE